MYEDVPASQCRRLMGRTPSALEGFLGPAEPSHVLLDMIEIDDIGGGTPRCPLASSPYGRWEDLRHTTPM